MINPSSSSAHRLRSRCQFRKSPGTCSSSVSFAHKINLHVPKRGGEESWCMKNICKLQAPSQGWEQQRRAAQEALHKACPLGPPSRVPQPLAAAARGEGRCWDRQPCLPAEPRQSGAPAQGQLRSPQIKPVGKSESQNHQIPEPRRGRAGRDPWGSPTQPPAQAGSPRAGHPALHPAGV